MASLGQLVANIAINEINTPLGAIDLQIVFKVILLEIIPNLLVRKQTKCFI
jgi:hypothetical protein